MLFILLFLSICVYIRCERWKNSLCVYKGLVYGWHKLSLDSNYIDVGHSVGERIFLWISKTKIRLLTRKMLKFGFVKPKRKQKCSSKRPVKKRKVQKSLRKPKCGLKWAENSWNTQNSLHETFSKFKICFKKRWGCGEVKIYLKKRWEQYKTPNSP